MANTNADVLRVEALAAAIETTIREKQLGFVTDTDELAFKETGGSVRYYTKKGGDYYVGEYVYHDGDTDTFIRYRDDRLTFEVGGQAMFDLLEGATDIIEINPSENDVDFIINANSIENAFFVEGSTGYVGIGTNAPDNALEVYVEDAVNNDITYPVKISHYTTGTPAEGLGVGIELEGEGTYGAVLMGKLFAVNGAGSYGTNAVVLQNYASASTLSLSGSAGNSGACGLYGQAPTINFYDTNCGDGDISASIVVNHSESGSGIENIDMSFKQQVAGTLTEWLMADADGDITFDMGAVGSRDYVFKAKAPELKWYDNDGPIAVMSLSAYTDGSTAASQVVSLKTLGTSAPTTETLLSYSSGKLKLGSDISSYTAIGTASGFNGISETVLSVENDTDNIALSMLCPNNKVAGIFFGDSDDNDIGSITYSHVTNKIALTVGASELFTFESTGDFVVNDKVKYTPEGGIAVKLTNNQGTTVTKGQIMEADSSADDALVLAAAATDHPCAVVYDASIADGAEGWFVIYGIADVAYEDNVAAVRTYWVGASDSEAGYATTQAASPGFASGHFDEVGHAIESVSAGGAGTHILGRVILHWN